MNYSRSKRSAWNSQKWAIQLSLAWHRSSSLAVFLTMKKLCSYSTKLEASAWLRSTINPLCWPEEQNSQETSWVRFQTRYSFTRWRCTNGSNTGTARLIRQGLITAAATWSKLSTYTAAMVRIRVFWVPLNGSPLTTLQIQRMIVGAFKNSIHTAHPEQVLSWHQLAR